MKTHLQKIGIIDRSSSGWSAGESYTKSVLRSLEPICRAGKVQLLLFTPGDGQAFAAFANVRVVRFQLNHSKDGLIEALTQESPDVLYPVLDDPVHRMPCPVIAWIPDLQHRFLPQYFNKSELAYRDQLFKTIADQAAFTVASSEDSRTALIQQGFATAKTAQSLPFPSSLLEMELPGDPLPVLEKYRLPRKFALVANQFWKHKNHETVVRALALARKEIPDATLVFTGMPTDFRDSDNSTLSSLFQQIASSSLNDRIVILGHVPRKDLVDLMRVAAVVIQPSCFEGWSTSVEDAKTLGRPVICSDLAVLKEQAPDSLGFFVVADPESLAQILVKEWPALVPGPDPQKEQASRIIAKTTAENFGAKLFDLCQKAATSGKRPDPAVEPIAPDLMAWEFQKKDAAIYRLKQEVERLKSRRQGDSPDFPVASAIGSHERGFLIPPALAAGLTAGIDPFQKEQALRGIRDLLEEKGLHLATLPVFNWPELREIGLRIFRWSKGKKTEPDTQTAFWTGIAKYYQAESVLHLPSFLNPTALGVKIRLFCKHPNLFVSGFIYKKWAKHRPARLGILHQHGPKALKDETFPKPDSDPSKLPSISIVTPSYNQGAFIEATLRSVLDQNYPNLEYHVQDGGSQDDTVGILNRFNDQLSSFQSAPDQGQVDAILKGFQRCTGDIMAWINSDDLLTPGSLRYVGEYFANHPEVDVVYGHRIVIDENSQEVGRWFLPSHSVDVLKWVDFVPQETLFWRRRAWQKIGGLDSSFHFALDWDFLLRLEKNGAVIHRLPYFLGCFRVHSSQKTSSLMHSTGKEEMDRLRLREFGGPLSAHVMNFRVKPFLVRSSLCELFWKMGIRI